MPNARVLEEKKSIVAGLVDKLQNSAAGVLVDYTGINVADDTKLRKELREAGVDYAVVKNTLLRFAVREAGFDALEEVLEGTTALAVSKEDPIIAAKIIDKYTSIVPGDAFKVKAGFMDGAVIDVATVKEIATIPSQEELIAKMLSSLNAPLTNFAIVLDQIAEKGGAAAEAEAPAEEAPAAEAAEAPAEEAPAEAEAEAPAEEAPAAVPTMDIPEETPSEAPRAYEKPDVSEVPSIQVDDVPEE